MDGKERTGVGPLRSTTMELFHRGFLPFSGKAKLERRGPMSNQTIIIIIIVILLFGGGGYYYRGRR